MKFLLFPCLILLSFSAYSQNNTVIPDEAKSFVLTGYEVLDYIIGDLNNDKRPDAMMVLKLIGEDTLMLDNEKDAKRPLLLLIRQANGKLKLAKRNDDVVMCRQCGGMYGDPYVGIKISPGSFILQFYGGSPSWRWGFDYSFRFNSLKKDWFIEQELESLYHMTEPDKSRDLNIGVEELGEISFEKYKPHDDSEETTWKVKAAKTFFYNNPDLKSKPRKGYLVKGDKVISSRELKNFIRVYFSNKKERISEGFILKKDLEKKVE